MKNLDILLEGVTGEHVEEYNIPLHEAVFNLANIEHDMFFEGALDAKKYSMENIANQVKKFIAQVIDFFKNLIARIIGMVKGNDKIVAAYKDNLAAIKAYAASHPDETFKAFTVTQNSMETTFDKMARSVGKEDIDQLIEDMEALDPSKLMEFLDKPTINSLRYMPIYKKADVKFSAIDFDGILGIYNDMVMMNESIKKNKDDMVAALKKVKKEKDAIAISIAKTSLKVNAYTANANISKMNKVTSVMSTLIKIAKKNGSSDKDDK